MFIGSRVAGVVVVGSLAMSGALAGPAAVQACAPYTSMGDPDEFGLSRGAIWVFGGQVVEELPNRDLPG